MSATRVYIDTSIYVKRYVKETDTEITDNIFRQAQRGEPIICSSEINVRPDARDRLHCRCSSTSNLC